MRYWVGKTGASVGLSGLLGRCRKVESGVISCSRSDAAFHGVIDNVRHFPPITFRARIPVCWWHHLVRRPQDQDSGFVHGRLGTFRTVSRIQEGRRPDAFRWSGRCDVHVMCMCCSGGVEMCDRGSEVGKRNQKYGAAPITNVQSWPDTAGSTVTHSDNAAASISSVRTGLRLGYRRRPGNRQAIKQCIQNGHSRIAYRAVAGDSEQQRDHETKPMESVRIVRNRLGPKIPRNDRQQRRRGERTEGTVFRTAFRLMQIQRWMISSLLSLHHSVTRRRGECRALADGGYVRYVRCARYAR